MALIASAALTSDIAQAAPTSVCTAAQIVAADPDCPSSGLCKITKIFQVGDGCVLDFGTREVRVMGTGELRIDTGEVTLKAGKFTVYGGMIDGTTATTGGSFNVQASGDILINYSPTGKIVVNGAGQGGSILLEAGGNITVAGQLKASNNSITASGGDITLRAGGNILTTATSIIDPKGGLQGDGGLLDFTAGGWVDIGSQIDITGWDGGSIDVEAGANVILRAQLVVTGAGDAGSGGTVDIVAGTNVEINAQIKNMGTGSAIDSGGGDGGSVFITASFGNIIVRNEINAKSGPPDGLGGDIELFAHDSIDIQSTALLNSEGGGGQSDGGDIFLDAKRDIMVNGLLSALGGDSGGDIELAAGRNVTTAAPVDARAVTPGGFGGVVTIEAGVLTPGTLTVASMIDAGGPGCDAWGFCALGGDIDLTACDVTIAAGVLLDATAPGSNGSGGTVFITARDQMTIQGTIDSSGAGGNLDGWNKLFHPIGIPPVVTGTILPAPILTPRALCTAPAGQPATCLVPCPTCGNGVTEYPETCDTPGTPESCDGCSVFCKLENCDDQSPCTTDSCDSVLGCRNAPVPDGTACSDGTVCDGAEFCLGGICKAGQPLNCQDTNVCTLDTCDPVTGCHNTPTAGLPCSDGNMCTANDSCNSSGTCISGSPLVCNDGKECTQDSCNPVSGCVFSAAPRAGMPCTDDGNPCTVDLCGLSGECAHLPGNEGGGCEDGNLCTVNDTCQNGACVPGSAVTCPPADQCHDAGTCNPGTGQCSSPAKPNGTPCNDGSLCTQTDTCQGGTCTGTTTVVCTALDQCHDVGTCNPGTGACSNPAKPNGTPCDDGQFCTDTTCQTGTCTPSPHDCDDGNVCTSDSCNEAAATCEHELVMPCCGNGIVEAGEECDEGTQNSDEPNASCRTDCKVSQCGNGVVDDLLGETCDLGQDNSDEPNATCRTNCLGRRCGDGIVDDVAGEQCDDGATDPGDGCSPRCFVDPPAGARLIPGKGSQRTDCVIEWKMANPELDRKGLPAARQYCLDGDPSCDQDGVYDGECTLHVWVCSNNIDAQVPFCEAGNQSTAVGVVGVAEVKRPSLLQALKRPADAHNRDLLMLAAAAAPAGSSLNVCGPRLAVKVLRKGPGKKGVASLKLRATTSRGVNDTDSLKLFCLP